MQNNIVIQNNNDNAFKFALYISKMLQPHQVKINGEIAYITLNLEDFSSYCNISYEALIGKKSFLNTRIKCVKDDEVEFWSLVPYLKILKDENIIELRMWTIIFNGLNKEEIDVKLLT